MIKSKFWKILSGLLLTGILLTSTPQWQSAYGQETPTVPNLDIILIIDQSQSMYYRNDPQSWRIVMADLFVDLLGVDQSGASHRLGILLFGDPQKVKWISQLSDISTPGTRQNIKLSLDTNNKNMGSTWVPDAIRAAQEELDKNGRPNAKKAIVFLSDGYCQINDPPTTEEIELCNREIDLLITRESKPLYPIYTIALTEAAFNIDKRFGIYENLWQQIASQTGALYFKPKKAEGDLLAVYMKIIYHLLNLPSEDLQEPVSVPIEVNFDVPDGLLQIVFSVIKYDKGVITEIIRPDGSIIRPDNLSSDVKLSSSAQTDVYSVLKPVGGKWIVRLSGRGKASILTVRYPVRKYTVVKILPGVTHPWGKPMDIRLQIVDANQSPQTMDTLSTQIIFPDTNSSTLNLSPGDQSTYYAQLNDTLQTGQYILRISGSKGGGFEGKVEDEQYVEVIKAPWLKITQPEPGQVFPSNQPVEVNAQLMFGDKPFNISGSQNTAQVTARLQGETASTPDQSLVLQSDGTLTGALQPVSAGDFYLHSEMVYTNQATGESFTDVSEIPIQIKGEAPITNTPTPTPTKIATFTPTFTPTVISPTHTPTKSPTLTRTPKPPLTDEEKRNRTIAAISGLVCGIGALILLGLAGGFGWWWYSKPSLVGMLESTTGLYPLGGKTAIYIGSDPKAKINIPDLSVLGRHAVLRPIGDRKSPRVEIRSVDPNHPVVVNGYETTFQILQDGDRIQIGNYSYNYSGPSDSLDFDNLSTGTGTTEKWNF